MGFSDDTVENAMKIIANSFKLRLIDAMSGGNAKSFSTRKSKSTKRMKKSKSEINKGFSY